ncbi:MAG: phosphodiester glycosidase family protein [Synechococcales bacterium]|nr:phosphodiester glycosidase family protein [Synechococcales bacterium]
MGSATLSSTSPVSQGLPQTVPIRYEVHALDRATAHVVRIPKSEQYRIVTAVAPNLETLATLANQTGAIAAINAGYFDPQNGQTTSYVTTDGVLVADPRQNARLVENPDLTPYLARILNRSEFRRYDCEAGETFAIARHEEPTPDGCQLKDAVGGGPQILPDLLAEEEAFVERVGTEVVRDAIGSFSPNARSAVGITPSGEVLLVMVSQEGGVGDRPGGLSLPELADLMRSLGAQAAMNLDGGSSTSLYYDGTTRLGRLDANGQPVERPVKSVILVLPVSGSAQS